VVNSYWVINKQDPAPYGLQTVKIISRFIGCQKPLNSLPSYQRRTSGLTFKQK